MEWEYVLVLSGMLGSVSVILPFIVTVIRTVMEPMDSRPCTCLVPDGTCTQYRNKWNRVFVTVSRSISHEWQEATIIEEFSFRI